LVFLQVLIALTGNYCFFNLLALALCLTLFEDSWAAPLLGRRLRPGRGAAPPGPARRWALRLLAALTLGLGSLQVSAMLHGPWRLPRPVSRLARAVEPFRVVNTYGLFAIMTTVRDEISVEGSLDGKDWKEYRFRWKPGDPLRRPAFVAPHQPRLDWQMWFAALGPYQASPWFLRFLSRLIERSPPVLGLLAEDPFPGQPPLYLRTLLYEYRFSTPEERKATGAWWVREPRGLYTPVLKRRG
jgi:hypothetical protein